MLKALNIHTVELLAGLSDGNLTFMGARTMRDKAKAYLAKANENADAVKFAEDTANLQAQIDALTNQLQGFRNAGVQEATAPPKKRGPKPKVNNEQDIPTTNTADS